MKATGVVRRIDDLGRIVIPKEIRKTLRIKDGESVEIFLDKDNIVLKRYSPLFNLPNFYVEYVDSIQSELGGNVFIIDRDKIVAVSGDLKKKYLDIKISDNLDSKIQKGKLITVSKMEEINIADDNFETGSYVISPIASNGYSVGAIMFLSNEKLIDDLIIKTSIISANFLSKYIE